MSVYSPEYHAMVPSPSPAAQTSPRQRRKTPPRPRTKAGTKRNQGEGFFHHLLDVINPLQHLPVIGTIYRAITGEHIGAVERIAGDTLYGGLWGAVSSIADVAFEGITGKSAEDTVLSWFKSDSPSPGRRHGAHHHAQYHGGPVAALHRYAVTAFVVGHGCGIRPAGGPFQQSLDLSQTGPTAGPFCGAFGQGHHRRHGRPRACRLSPRDQRAQPAPVFATVN